MAQVNKRGPLEENKTLAFIVDQASDRDSQRGTKKEVAGG